MPERYQTETSRATAQYINAGFYDKIKSGRVKEAEEQASAFIRDRLRQSSFAREVIPPQKINDDELDRDENTDLPKKIVEIEPDSTATYVPFPGSARRNWFSGRRFPVFFGKIESERFQKSKFELMTYQNDIRKIISDNSVDDMADQEDIRFYETIDAIIQNNPGQEITASGGISADVIKRGFQNMLERKIAPAKILMTKELYMDVLSLPATSVGDDVASRHYDEGAESEEMLWGKPVITTIKRDILPPNEILIFGPENYLGKFFLLQDATMFIKQEADNITFHTYSVPGIGIGNIKAVTRIRFT